MNRAQLGHRDSGVILPPKTAWPRAYGEGLLYLSLYGRHLPEPSFALPLLRTMKERLYRLLGLYVEV